MRDDLSHAQASVDWAVARLPDLQERLDSWTSANVSVEIEDAPPPAGQNPVVATLKEPIPLAFSVEVGAYLNTIRSGLDLLATALAHRFGLPKPDKQSFPIAKSEAEFVKSKDISKYIKGLHHRERCIIESLRPYPGGHPALYTLHRLDIMRKHRRLIDVAFRVRMGLVGPRKNVFVSTEKGGGWRFANGRATLGWIRKDAAHEYTVHLHAFVLFDFDEVGAVEKRPVVGALDYFARETSAVIKLFDTP